MTTDDYIKDRLDQQITWYERKSSINKKRYKVIKLMVITISVLIPFLAGLMSDARAWIKIAIGLGGVMIAFCEAILSLYKYQDTWLEYRNTAEMLKRERIMFLTKTGQYKNNQSLNTLVERAEVIMNNENQTWTETRSTAEDENKS